MAARNRLPPWHEQLRLHDGREILIRPIRPEDIEPLRAGFTLLQPEEIRQRFLQPLEELSPEFARRLTHPNPKTEFALVATEPLPPGEALVGAVARASVIRDSNDAEFAILVSRFVKGMGLGRHLMQRVTRWARNRKLDRLQGDVLDDNEPMLALAESLGFRREPSGTDGMARVVLDLRQDAPAPAESGA